MNAKGTRPARDRKPNDSCKCGAVLTAIFPRFRSQRLASKLSRKHTTSKLHASSLEWGLIPSKVSIRIAKKVLGKEVFMRSVKVWFLVFGFCVLAFLVTSNSSTLAGNGAPTNPEKNALFFVPEGVAVSSPQTQTVVSGFDFSGIDKSAFACTDFFQYANGGWITRNPIPPAYSSWGRFQMLDDANLVTLQGILDSLAKKKLKPGSN